MPNAQSLVRETIHAAEKGAPEWRRHKRPCRSKKQAGSCSPNSRRPRVGISISSGIHLRSQYSPALRRSSQRRILCPCLMPLGSIQSCQWLQDLNA